MWKVSLFVVLLCGMLALGQTTKDKSTSPALSVDVDLVLINATVTDSGNRPVSGLTQQDFQVWEDKIQQEIQYFSTENVPLSVAIIFDMSGSMANKLDAARAAANTFVRMGDREDEYVLIGFSDSPSLVQDFTSDITKLQNFLLSTRAKGNTALYDALYLGLDKVSKGNNSRKAVLLITDGEDNHSHYSFSNVREFASEHDASIYAIGILDEGTMRIANLRGRQLLQDLANLTGGAAFFPPSVDSLESICAQIGLHLKNQYVLGYRSLNLSKDGKWRKVRVKVNRPAGKPALNVRTKSGYFAPTIAKAMK